MSQTKGATNCQHREHCRLKTNKPMKQRTVGWDQTLGQNMAVHPLFLKFLIQKGFTPFRLFKLRAHLSSGFAPAP